MRALAGVRGGSVALRRERTVRICHFRKEGYIVGSTYRAKPELKVLCRRIQRYRCCCFVVLVVDVVVVVVVVVLVVVFVRT